MLRTIRLNGNAAAYGPLRVLRVSLYEIDGGAPAALRAAGPAPVVSQRKSA